MAINCQIWSPCCRCRDQGKETEQTKQETDFYTQANFSLEKFNVLLKFFKKDKILNIIDSG